MLKYQPFWQHDFNVWSAKKKNGKDEFQSGEERAGDASEGLALEQLRFLFQGWNELVRAKSRVEAEKLKSGKNLKFKSKPEPFLHKPQKRFGIPANFNRAWVYSGAARERVRHPPESRLFASAVTLKLSCVHPASWEPDVHSRPFQIPLSVKE